MGLPGGELPSIVEKIFDRDFEQAGIAGGEDVRLNAPSDVALRLRGLQFVGNGGNDGAQIKGLRVELRSGNAREA